MSHGFETCHVTGMMGSDDSTKFSPWLASGCLSPRQIYYSIKSYENKRTANKST